MGVKGLFSYLGTRYPSLAHPFSNVAGEGTTQNSTPLVIDGNAFVHDFTSQLGDPSNKYEFLNMFYKTFSNYKDLLASDLVDAVIIATPNHTHVTVLKDAIATDLHIFIEKPLCTTVEDCADVIEWSKDRKKLVWMGLEYRYMPPVAELINIVKRHNEEKKYVNRAIELVIAAGGIEYAHKRMIELKTQALDLLTDIPDSPAKRSLVGLVEYTVNREK